MPYVWTDTGYIINMPYQLSTHFNFISAFFNANLWRDTGAMLARYMPLTEFQIAVQMALFPTNTMPSTIFMAFMYGLLAVAIYLLATEITGKKWLGLAVVILLSFSLPAIQASWVLLENQASMECLVMFGLYGFIRYRKTKNSKWLILVTCCSLIAPLVRELGLVLPTVCLFDAIVEKMWNKKLLILLSCLFLYAMFPSTIPNLFLGKFVFIPAISRGVPRISVDLWGILPHLSFNMSAHLMLFIPPILLLLVVIACAIFISQKFKTITDGNIIATIIVLLVLYGSLFFIGANIGVNLLSILLIMAIGISIYFYNKFLAVWFVIAWIPFFWLYNTIDTGLLAPAIPLTIIMVMWLSQLPKLWGGAIAKYKNSKLLNNTARILFIVMLIIGFSCQLSNVIIAYATFKSQVATNEDMASWLVNNIPSNSIVVTDLINGAEIRYYANDYYENVESMNDPDFPPNAPDLPSYEQLINDNFNNHTMYVLIGVEMKTGLDFWLTNPPDATLQLVKQFKMSCNYPVIDPIKWIMPETLRPYGGSTDLFPQVANSGSGFIQTSYARYNLYKIVSYNGN
jgi:hypothetical protein